MSAAPSTQPIIIDGYLVDPESGEIIGIAAKPDSFHVTTVNDAEWVMEKMSELDADINALDARLKALAENMTAMKRDKERRKAFLLYRFGPELESPQSVLRPNGLHTGDGIESTDMGNLNKLEMGAKIAPPEGETK